MYLSVIIPVLDESGKIRAHLSALTQYLEEHAIESEILVVDDGSIDGTLGVVESFIKKHENDIVFKLIQLSSHRGKGFAVKEGVKQAEGEIIAFMDCGNCVPYKFLSRGIELIEKEGVDIAHASRRLKESKIIRNQSLKRRLFGYGFRLVIKHLLKIPGKLSDTQCGFKLYKGKVAKDLYNSTVCDGFLFDIEIVIQACRQGYSIREFPVEWTCDPDSRLKTLNTFKTTIEELRALKKL